MARKILGIIGGYAIFVVTSVALFTLSGHHPHSEASTVFMVLTAIYGAFFHLLPDWLHSLSPGPET